MEVLVYRGLFLFSVLLSLFGWITQGAPGAVAGLLVGVFLCFGLGGIVATRGILGGIGGVFIWFLAFCGVMMGMFLWERYFIDRGPIAGKEFGPGGSYFADKVMDIVGLWLSLGQPPASYGYVLVFVIVGFVVSAALGNKR